MGTYAGDVLPAKAWGILKDDPVSALIDVRTGAEWSFVGVPDLSDLDKPVHLVAWLQFPGMAPNTKFESEIDSIGLGRDAPLLFLCRSGQRSRAAAMAMTAAGYSRCFNIAHGFEGDCNGARQRGQVNGWKASELPWVQQ